MHPSHTKPVLVVGGDFEQPHSQRSGTSKAKRKGTRRKEEEVGQLDLSQPGNHLIEIALADAK